MSVILAAASPAGKQNSSCTGLTHLALRYIAIGYTSASLYGQITKKGRKLSGEVP